MATGTDATLRQTSQQPSYRRDRNYGTHITWSEDLNSDLYACYLKATQTKTVGYTRRLKQYFDEMRPSLAHLTPKQLRQQVHNFLKKKKSPECNVNSNNNERSMDIVNDRNTTTSREQSNTEDSRRVATSLSQRSNDTDCQCNVKEAIRKIFQEEIALTNSLEIQQRTVRTDMNKNIKDEILAIADEVGRDYLGQCEILSLRVVNSSLYALAIAMKKYNGDNRTATERVTRELKETPNRWGKQERQINAIRRDISNIEVVLNCKKANQYTKRQQRIQDSLAKKFGDTKQKTLRTRTSLLKQELKAVSEKCDTKNEWQRENE
ncbi:hypothetical protein Ahia01_001270200 [Argonauta hians]